MIFLLVVGDVWEVVDWLLILIQIPNFPHNLSASKFSKISTNTSSNIHPKVYYYFLPIWFVTTKRLTSNELVLVNLKNQKYEVFYYIYRWQSRDSRYFLKLTSPFLSTSRAVKISRALALILYFLQSLSGSFLITSATLASAAILRI